MTFHPILTRLAPTLHPLYRHVAFPLAQRIVRRDAHAVLQRLRVSEYAPPEALRAHQDDRLRALVRWSYDTVPAYRERFDRAGVRPGEIRTAADLARLPVLARRDLKASPGAYLSRAMSPARHWMQRTSGSTGEPLRAIRDAALRPVGQGTWWHTLARCGISPADVLVDISAHQASDRPWQKPWQRKVSPLLGLLPIPMATLFARDVEAISAVLHGWRPRLISGQPHRLAQLARMVVDGEVRLAPPKAVVYYGSMVTEPERAIISRAFGAPIHSRYGAIEFVPYIAYTCEHGEFHVNVHHFIVEIAATDRVERPGAARQAGRILITDLTNFVAPYVRYDVGDLAAWEDGTCACGRTWPRLKGIEGRRSEAAVTASGREISQSGLSRVMFRAIPDLPDLIWEYQFRQHALDDIELMAVSRPAYRIEHTRTLEAALNAYAGGEIRFRIAVVDAIPGGVHDGKRPLLMNLMDRGGTEIPPATIIR